MITSLKIFIYQKKDEKYLYNLCITFYVGWNFSIDGSVMFLKTFLRTKSPGWNIQGFTRLLYRFASLRWYNAIRTAAASPSSFSMSWSLITYSVFDCLGISVRSVGIPISIGTIASIP